MPLASVRVLALNVHAGFACRHSGACCTAGWPIPVEADVAAAIQADRFFQADALRTRGPLPDGAAAILEPMVPAGACPFFNRAGGNLCAVQQRLGHASLPASCRHFPRVALLEADAVRVTLSHFCPTAAWMLFRTDIPRLAIVQDAAGAADRHEYDGFDASRTIPPLLRPGVAMDAATCRLWEQHLLEALDSGDRAPEDLLAGVAVTTDTIRNWTAGPESIEARTSRAIADAEAHCRPHARCCMTLSNASRLFRLAVASIPPGLARPGMPDGAEAADLTRVMPRWADLARPIGRYLAARSFGAWSAYLGEGLRTQLVMLAVALAAVRIEAVRETARASRLLDEPLLHAAIRSADLLLHHLSDTANLVRSLAGVELGPLPVFLDAVGLEAAP